MKKAYLLAFCLSFLLLGSLHAIDEIKVGNVNIPRDFVHGGKDFPKGVYQFTLVDKEGVPTFIVTSKENEPLFEEMAVIKPYSGKSKKFKHRISKVVLKGYEYYRLKVTTPESLYMAYLLLKK